MATLTEGARTAEFIQSEANGYRSREAVTVLSTAALSPGQVLGKITSAGATAAAQAGNTGDATSSAVVTDVNVQPGAYNVEFISATEFLVTDPSGEIIGNGTTGTEFDVGNEIVFTITAGATPMVVGDGFTITVAAGSGKYAAYDDTAINGTATAAGVLYAATPASHDGAAVALVRDAEVKLTKLIQGGTEATVVAELANLGIIARS